MAEIYQKHNNLNNVDDMLDKVIAALLLAGWTDASGGAIDFGTVANNFKDNGKHVHMRSPGGVVNVNLATGFRSIARQADDHVVTAQDHIDGKHLRYDVGSKIYRGTPVKNDFHFFDYNKNLNGSPPTPQNNPFPWDYNVSLSSPYSRPDLEWSWLAMNCSDGAAFWDDQLEWYNQPGEPIWNSEAGKGIGTMMMYNSNGIPDIDMGAEIPELWIFCFDNPSTCFIMTRKVNASGLVVWQWLYFGEDINKGSVFNGGSFHNGSMLYNSPTRRSDTNQFGGEKFEDPTTDFSETFYSNAVSHPGVRSPGSTFIKVTNDPEVSRSSGAASNYWGSGGANICSSPPYNYGGVRSERGLGIPIAEWSASDNGNAFPINDIDTPTQGPNPSFGYDSARGYSKLDEILCFRRAVNGGGYFLGCLPHIYLTSTESYIGGNIVQVDGDDYVIFPMYTRTAPWKKDRGNSSDADEQTREFNNWGVGFAIRKPA